MSFAASCYDSRSFQRNLLRSQLHAELIEEKGEHISMRHVLFIKLAQELDLALKERDKQSVESEKPESQRKSA